MALIGGYSNANTLSFQTANVYVSGAIPNQAKAAAKPVQTMNPGIVTKSVYDFQPTTTELIIVGGLAAFFVLYFATHNRGK